jgi:ABC-type branched-subunit amino acid transport system ATPase component
MLSVRDLHAAYGDKNVLHGVSLEVPRGMIVTVLGANGAGKSTLLKTIVGLLPRTAGTIDLDAVPLPTATPDRRAFAHKCGSHLSQTPGKTNDLSPGRGFVRKIVDVYR